MTRAYVQKGWTFAPGEGCEFKMFAPASGKHEADCPWRWKVERNGKRYCGVHDPKRAQARRAAKSKRGA